MFLFLPVVVLLLIFPRTIRVGGGRTCARKVLEFPAFDCRPNRFSYFSHSTRYTPRRWWFSQSTIFSKFLRTATVVRMHTVRIGLSVLQYTNIRVLTQCPADILRMFIPFSGSSGWSGSTDGTWSRCPRPRCSSTPSGTRRRTVTSATPKTPRPWRCANTTVPPRRTVETKLTCDEAVWGPGRGYEGEKKKMFNDEFSAKHCKSVVGSTRIL